MRDRWNRTPKALLVTALVVLICGVVAILTHELNVGYGDDYALYIRQARSLLDGDVARVINDNAYTVTAKGQATPEFSPMVYPWVTSLLMVPFVRLFGHTNFADLRLAEVVFLCVWVVAFMVLLRRRVPLAAAAVITLCVAVNVQYAAHTNSVLSEIPYLMMATLLFVLIDHVQQRHHPLRLPWATAWSVGIMGCLVFNTRREALAILPAFAVWQAAVWWRGSAAEPRSEGEARDAITKAAGRPYLTFAASTFLFHLMLPSTLVPSYEGSSVTNSFGNLIGGYRRKLGEVLGFEWVPTLLVVVVLVLAVLGAVQRLRNNDDVFFLTFVGISTFLVAGHRVIITRYLMLAIPFLLYLAYHGWVWLIGRVAARATKRVVFGLLPTLGILGTTLLVTVEKIDDVQTRRSNGVYELGPGSFPEDAGFDAVRALTSADDVVAFFKARLMTLLTDRRSVQTAEREVILSEADYYLQRYDQFEPPTEGFSPFLGVPQFDEQQAAEAGLVEVWRNDRWVLWKVPQP